MRIALRVLKFVCLFLFCVSSTELSLKKVLPHEDFHYNLGLWTCFIVCYGQDEFRRRLRLGPCCAAGG